MVWRHEGLTLPAGCPHKVHSSVSEGNLAFCSRTCRRHVEKGEYAQLLFLCFVVVVIVGMCSLCDPALTKRVLSRFLITFMIMIMNSMKYFNRRNFHCYYGSEVVVTVWM